MKKEEREARRVLSRRPFDSDDAAREFIKSRGLRASHGARPAPGEGAISYRSGTAYVSYWEAVVDEPGNEKRGHLAVAPRDVSTNSLREVLFDELRALQSGSSDEKRARAVVAVAGAVLATKRLELDFAMAYYRATEILDVKELGLSDGGAARPVARLAGRNGGGVD